MNERSTVVIPDRPAFKASEVCELLGIQPYVLRTWENEFEDLGVTRSAGGPRLYRRRDVELALRIKALVFTDGLTLAGARRRLEQERLLEPLVAAGEEEAGVDPAAPDIDAGVRDRLAAIKRGLRDILEVLASPPGAGTGGASAPIPPRGAAATVGSSVPASLSSPSAPASGSGGDPGGRGEPRAVEFELVPGEGPHGRATGARAGDGSGGAREGGPRRSRSSPITRTARRAT